MYCVVYTVLTGYTTLNLQCMHTTLHLQCTRTQYCTYSVHHAALMYSECILHCTYSVHYTVLTVYTTLYLPCTLHCTSSVHYSALTVYTTLHLPCTLYLPKYRPCRESSHRNSNHPSPETIRMIQYAVHYFYAL